MSALNMQDQQSSDPSRFGRIVDGLMESLKLLKELSVDGTNSALSPSMLREQTLANVSFILEVYVQDGGDFGYLPPTIIIARKEKQVYAAVVRSRFSRQIQTVFEGPKCLSDVKALEGLYELSKDAVERVKILAARPQGFNNWGDLNLS